MDAKQLLQWEIKDLTAEKAVDWLTKTNHVSGHTALFGLAYFIQRQSDKIAESGKLIERQEKMINTAIDVIQEDSGDCPLNAGCCCVEDEQCNGPCPLDGSDEQAIKCWRKWLEEAGGE